MIIFDATTLMLSVNPQAGKPIDIATGKEVDHVEERIHFLLSKVDKEKSKIGIPAPALSEAIVRTKLHPADVVAAIQSYAIFQILPFDDKAAIELALINRTILSLGDKRDGSDEPWNKIKYDRQIVAISKVANASHLYTDDKGLRNAAKRVNLKVLGLSDLTLPPERAQTEMTLVLPEVEPDILSEIEEIHREADTDGDKES